jgi:hypothetical protein
MVEFTIFLALFSSILSIVVIRWVWLININAQKIKKLQYAATLLQYEQFDRENGASKLEAVIKSKKSDLSDPFITKD